MEQERLLRIYAFLEETEKTNEDTEFGSAQEPLVDSVIELVKQKGKTSIIEDFETPFVHPMITIQKWVEELKEIVRNELDHKTPEN